MKAKYVWVTGLGSLVVALTVSTANAAERPQGDQPIDEARQERMLERFGDEGIDADGDGILTRDEVRAFFADRDDRPRRGMKGRRGMDGERRGREPGRGPGPGQVFMIINQLELLASETVPAGVTAEGLPRADADEDGVLTDAEWQTFAAQRSTRILNHLLKQHPEADTDEDGALSAEELAAFKAAEQEKAKQMILLRDAEADTDGDGVLSDAEFEAFTSARQAENRARMLERHPAVDVDGDGIVSEAEAAAFMLQRPQRGPREGRGLRDGKGPHEGRGPRDGQGRGRGPGRGPGPRPDCPNAPVDDEVEQE